ncbi:MAG: AsmA-like C-terminal domain-containing protein [Desulfamplus sp.]
MSNLEDISGRLQKGVVLFAFVIGFLIFLFISTPVILDSNSVQKILSGFIVKQLNQTLNLKQDSLEAVLLKGVRYKFKLALFPLPAVELSDIKFTTPPLENSTIKKLSIILSLNSFTKRQVLIKNITADGLIIPKFDSIRSLPFTQDQKLFNYLARDQEDFEININNIQSDIFKKADISVLISHADKSILSDIIINDFILKRDAKSYKNIKNSVSDAASATKTSDTKTIGTKASATNIKIDKIICNAAILQNQFTIDLSHISLHPFASDLSIGFKYEKNKDIDKNQVHETTELMFDGKDVDINTVRPVALGFLPNNKVAEKIFQILYRGLAKNIRVVFKSSSTKSYSDNNSGKPKSYLENDTLFSENSIKKLFNPLKMVITGDIKNGTINIPATKLTATETDALVSVKDGVLHTKIAKGFIDQSTVDNGTLDVNLVNPVHNFSGEFDITADLTHLNGVLQELLSNRDICNELALLHDIEGSTKGTLKLEGGRNRKLSVVVTTDNINLKGLYTRLPEKFSITNGKFDYNNKIISIKNINGTIGDSIFSNFAASLTLDKQHLLKIDSGVADIAVEKALPWFISSFKTDLSSILPIIRSSKGNIALKEISFKGALNNPKQWDYLFEGICNSMNDDMSDIKADFIISPSFSRIYIENALVKNTDIISDFTGQLMKNGLIKKEIFDQVKLLSDIKTPFTIKDIYFDKKEKFKGKLIFNNNMALSLSRDTAKATNSRTYQYQVKILKNGVESATILFNQKEIKIDKNRFKDISLKDDLSDNSDIKFTGSINTKDIEEILNPLSKSYKSLIDITDGKDITIESLKPDNYTVTIDELDLDFILAKQKLISVPLASALKEKSFKKDSSPIFLTINSDKFTDKKIIIVPFSAQIVINGKDKNIRIDNMQMCNVNGAIELNIKEDYTDFSLSLYDDNKDIEPVIGCFYKKRLMKGNYSLRASLYAKGSSSNSNIDGHQNVIENTQSSNVNISNIKSIIKNNLEGRVEMTSDGGRIFRLTLLSRILSVLNVLKLIEGELPDIEQNGFAFTSINLIADVEKSRILLKQAVINGIDMTLIFTGWIDIFTREIDLICLVAPLKTADRIIGKIPIINTMLGGRLISIPVKATGTLNSPEVTVINPSEMGKGFLNTIVDILTTPFKLFDNLRTPQEEQQ